MMFFQKYRYHRSDLNMSEKDREDPLWWAERLSELGMLIGASATFEHKFNYGRWYDEGKEMCHGGIGLWIFFGSLFIRGICAVIRTSRPVCPNCTNSLTYVFQEERFYCNNCQQYIYES